MISSRNESTILLGLCLVLAACGTRSSGSISPTAGAAPPPPTVSATPRDPTFIPVLATDITDRKYHSLGDVSVTVSKWTIFDADPTPAKVDEALRRRAADLAADAVILARYGTVGIGVMSWGTMDGKGRAIAYDR